MKKFIMRYVLPLHRNSADTAGEHHFFRFEDDFMEDGIRCIPMIVRFKLDACGIKLKLNEWSKLTAEERTILTEMDCSTEINLKAYRSFLQQLVFTHTGNKATDLPVDGNPAWSNKYTLPGMLQDKLAEFGWCISLQQWQLLSDLQRFVLLKLCRPGHENRNFPRAVKEFDLIH